MKNLTVNTKLISLLGMPLGQSYSPACQNAVYDELGLDYYYFSVEIPEKENFPHILNGLRRMNYAGFAVTKPYKSEVLQYLDEVDDIAKKMGSCNTVMIKDGKLIGYNTDGIGAVKSLEQDGGVTINGATFFCFGAGGTGKSVCFELASRGAKRIYISSRSELCEELADNINSYFSGVCVAIRAAESQKVLAAIAESEIILNLSGLGMASKADETPVDKSALKPEHICFDATYNPAKTLFLCEAEEKGCKIINGLNMMVYQGTRQINLWTGLPEPVEQMKRHLRTIVGID